MKQVILWTPEARRRAAETFEHEWAAFDEGSAYSYTRL